MCTDEEAIELKKQCVDMLFGCPRNRDLATCPFRKVREKDIVARVHWLKAQSMDALRRVLAVHVACGKPHDR